MLKPCKYCGKESIYGIMTTSCNNDPVGEFWFCCWQCVYNWIFREGLV